MQEYLRAELERLAARPSMDVWLERVRQDKRKFKSRVTTSMILKAIREGRRR